MRDVAHEFALPIFDPDDINSDEAIARLAKYKADLLIVCDYGQILSSDALATAHLGGVNLHGSLLPKYRGAAPINWAICNGEAETGVTVIHMTPRVDAGPCIAQARTPIDPDETAVALEARLCQIGSWLVRRTVDSLDAGRLEALPQDPALASKAPRLKKTDGRIDWNRPARAIKDQIRAMEPWPKTYTYWHRPDGPADAADPRPGVSCPARPKRRRPGHRPRSGRRPSGSGDGRRGDRAAKRSALGQAVALGRRVPSRLPRPAGAVFSARRHEIERSSEN